jgi:hypothetical protein
MTAADALTKTESCWAVPQECAWLSNRKGAVAPLRGWNDAHVAALLFNVECNDSFVAAFLVNLGVRDRVNS